MSSPEKDNALKVLTRQLLQEQIQAAEKFIEGAQQQVTTLQQQIQQQLGVAGLAKHILSTFEIPEKEEPTDERKES
jgi:hypothetical protein